MRCSGVLSDSYRIQTCNLLIRSQMLYSVELRSQYVKQCLFGSCCHLLLFDAGFLSCQAAEVEDTCATYFTILVNLD